jgi:hypothetical protein
MNPENFAKKCGNLSLRLEPISTALNLSKVEFLPGRLLHATAPVDAVILNKSPVG